MGTRTGLAATCAPRTTRTGRKLVDTLRESAEKELDRMIERRTREGEADAEEREDLWKQSVRTYNDRRSDEFRAAWCASTTGARPPATRQSSGT